MSKFAATENAGLDLAGKLAVIAGGTQGIGAATAIRFAKAGASVFIIGRNEELASAVIAAMKQVAKADQTFAFFKVDLSLVSGVKSVVASVIHELKGRSIDYLLSSAGAPPFAKFSLTSEGHEAHFAVQNIGRFGLSYLLAEAKVIALGGCIFWIDAPGGTAGKKALPLADLDDIEMIKAAGAGKYGLMTVVRNDAAVLDALTAEFPLKFPGLRAYHVAPGSVTTNIGRNIGFHPVFCFILDMLKPIIERTIGNSPAAYAEIPVYWCANPKSEAKYPRRRFSDEKLVDLEPTWLQEKPEIRQAIWEQMVAMLF